MAHGKTIKIFLESNDATGIKHAEVVNWTGQAILCPRPLLAALKEWPESQKPAVYLLFGENREGLPAVYVGEADNVFDRLRNHERNKDFWNEVVFFTNKDENLTKAHVQYLESRLCDLVREANRFAMENGNQPKLPSLPRSDRESMEEFVEYIRLLLGTMGYRVLEPNKRETSKVRPSAPVRTGGRTFKFAVRGVSATCLQTNDGFVVLKDSQAALKPTGSFADYFIKMREMLVEKKILKQMDKSYEFAEDFLFASSSTAASIVAGGQRNGRTSWIDEQTGKTLAEIEKEALS